MLYKYKYLLTIRKHQVKDFVDKNDLDDVVETLRTAVPSLHIGHHTYEIDNKYKQLHYHAIVSNRFRIRYKDNSKFNSFRIHWSPIGDEKGAIKYITKDAYNEYKQEYIHLFNYFNHHYGFV